MYGRPFSDPLRIKKLRSYSVLSFFLSLTEGVNVDTCQEVFLHAGGHRDRTKALRTRMEALTGQQMAMSLLSVDHVEWWNQ